MIGFWIVLSGVGVPLVLLAWRRRVYPGIGLACLAAFPVAGSVLLAVAAPGALPAVLVLDAAVALIAAVDLLSLSGRYAHWARDLVSRCVPLADLLPGRELPWFRVQRHVQRAASLGHKHPVELVISNLGRRGCFVQVRDDVPPEFEAQPDAFSLDLPRRGRATLRYHLTAQRRGAFTMNCVYLRIPSRLRLWYRLLRVDEISTLHVYPDMQQLREYAVLARTNRLSLIGMRRSRQIGQDNEFERLRDYTPDDNYKHIDWRATARRRKLTVKDFQANQSQTLMFLVDCGRMMTNESSGLTLLDHAFNAVLMLSYVALSRGDSVGMVAFSDQVHGFVPPRGGMGQMNRLLHAAFDRFPQLVESRYDQAFVYLNERCRKRSLVVLVTNLIDEVNSHQVQQYLANIAGRHLPLGVLLRDHRLFDAVDVPFAAGEALYRAAAAAEILSWRHRLLVELHSQGVLSLDVFPEELTAPLVNCYLDIKARHLL
jgi:uncharacterized protein (DUF58 family)